MQVNKDSSSSTLGVAYFNDQHRGNTNHLSWSIPPRDKYVCTRVYVAASSVVMQFRFDKLG